jgi:hypothetical protein
MLKAIDYAFMRTISYNYKLKVYGSKLPVISPKAEIHLVIDAI